MTAAAKAALATLATLGTIAAAAFALGARLAAFGTTRAALARTARFAAGEAAASASAAMAAALTVLAVAAGFLALAVGRAGAGRGGGSAETKKVLQPADETAGFRRLRGRSGTVKAMGRTTLAAGITAGIAAHLAGIEGTRLAALAATLATVTSFASLTVFAGTGTGAIAAVAVAAFRTERRALVAARALLRSLLGGAFGFRAVFPALGDPAGLGGRENVELGRLVRSGRRGGCRGRAGRVERKQLRRR